MKHPTIPFLSTNLEEASSRQCPCWAQTEQDSSNGQLWQASGKGCHPPCPCHLLCYLWPPAQQLRWMVRFLPHSLGELVASCDSNGCWKYSLHHHPSPVQATQGSQHKNWCGKPLRLELFIRLSRPWHKQLKQRCFLPNVVKIRLTVPEVTVSLYKNPVYENSNTNS